MYVTTFLYISTITIVELSKSRANEDRERRVFGEVWIAERKFAEEECGASRRGDFPGVAAFRAKTGVVFNA